MKNIQYSFKNTEFVVAADIDYTQAVREGKLRSSVTDRHSEELYQAFDQSRYIFKIDVTGLPLKLVLESYRQRLVFPAHVIIAEAGTEIYYRASEGAYVPEDTWKIKTKNTKLEFQILRKELARKKYLYEGGYIPDSDEPSPLKIPIHYHDDLSLEVRQFFRDNIQSLSQNMGIDIDITWWSSRGFDVVPRGFNKKKSLNHLLNILDPDGLKRIFYCGDSQNDAECLHHFDFALLPYNATQEALSAIKGREEGSFRVSTQSYAAGTLDNLKAFSILR